MSKSKYLALALLMGLIANSQAVDASATDITTAATTAFGGVATLCVAIGTFFVVYRLVKRIK
jgi:hypothetical protein